eukprot:TRINITY_DN4058_c0_g1_i7.p1 TRINITY_DN4058_c0_g1~~TRINITY_DN4058_c0_g1_i7.p1  ORF type:complete len:344 (+),score=40.09 TRINITY_DN4058_c0_g1_i7:147-1178(+)
MQDFAHTSPLAFYASKYKNLYKDHATKTKNFKVSAEYVNSVQNVQTSSINRSISLNKPPPALRQGVWRPSNPMGGTHFGQSFAQPRKKDVSPYSQHDACSKLWSGSMNRTANNWNARARNRLLKDKGEKASELRSSRSKCERLPGIGKNQAKFVSCVTGVDDAYISYVAQNKQSKSFVNYKTREKKQLSKSELAEENNVRAFNWEGIHFEVIPKRDNSLTSINDLQSSYKTDINLMSYNFNNCASKQPPSLSTSHSYLAETKAIPAYNKTSNDFYKGRRTNANRSPLAKYQGNAESTSHLKESNLKKYHTMSEKASNDSSLTVEDGGELAVAAATRSTAQDNL